ncbi:NTP hydrolase p-loop-containing [Desulfonema limicola]|uniref:DNA 3'-5' helicase n=1 Tax=Desulfonema limicola TaxID=45656 RepID=A0A975B4Z3_9BACT|nr:hypothetical protein [Desulfonema limicola]QTA78877.1 NTP hydrolase p-loop-containing [Desulfonema limicola]
MLIHIHYAEKGELKPVRLMFNFEESSFYHRFSLKNRGTGKKDDKPVCLDIIKGEQIFAQLLPGRGKSFCFFCPSARYELNIVISPLSSLMRDQGIPFRMNPMARDKIKNISYSDITLGKTRLLYIAPKSLISRSFRDDLNTIINGAFVNTLLIDNVHCISEWGDDFQPSYLRLPLVISDLRKQNPKLTTIALTAEPGKMVSRDILDILDLKDKTPDIKTNYYKNQISFQVSLVKDASEKEAEYQKILRKDIPMLLYPYGLFPEALTSFPLYHDPYTALLNCEDNLDSKNQVHNVIPDLAVTTRMRKHTAGAGHVLMHTTLGGSLENWMYQIARAGSSDKRVHCIRLADIPNESCETNMQQQRTRIPKCKNQTCSFGRQDLCDYGKQHHLILKNRPDMQESICETLYILDALISSHKTGDSPIKIQLLPVNQKKTEMALHRLSIIRVIDMFFIDFRERDPVFKIYGFSGSVHNDAALAGILTYLRRNDISSTKKYSTYSLEQLKEQTGEIERDREIYSHDIQAWIEQDILQGKIVNYSEYKTFFLQISSFMPLLLSYIYDEIQKIKYRRLWNLKEFVKNRTCRYNALLRNVQAVDEEWQCGQCDRCVPDLSFERSSRIKPPDHDRLKNFEDKFVRWLENDDLAFDSTTADQFIKDFNEYYYNINARVQNLLEHSPRNIKALYILCELSQEPFKDQYLMDLMNVAARDLKWLQAARLYETSQAGNVLKQEIFDLFDDEYGVMNIPEGEKWLYQEACSLFPHSEKTEVLGARVFINALQQTDLHQHNTKLNQLLKEF